MVLRDTGRKHPNPCQYRPCPAGGAGDRPWNRGIRSLDTYLGDAVNTCCRWAKQGLGTYVREGREGHQLPSRDWHCICVDVTGWQSPSICKTVMSRKFLIWIYPGDFFSSTSGSYVLKTTFNRLSLIFFIFEDDTESPHSDLLCIQLTTATFLHRSDTFITVWTNTGIWLPNHSYSLH